MKRKPVIVPKRGAAQTSAIVGQGKILLMAGDTVVLHRIRGMGKITRKPIVVSAVRKKTLPP